MIIAGEYSFKGGKDFLLQNHARELRDVYDAIAAINVEQFKTKVSEEQTMLGKMLYDPGALNRALKEEFASREWINRRVKCDYPTSYYVGGYKPSVTEIKGAFRDIDFVKNNVGVEVQFGKYAFAVYNVCAKMTIFKKLGIIQTGIEVVPVKDLVEDMSSGIIYFEQFIWDLEQRGVADIDIPVLILGIAA